MSARSDNETEASRRVKTEFLVQMQGVSNANSQGLLVLGATNLPWALDGGMRRRFEKRVYISLPDKEGRLYLLKNRMKNESHLLSDQDFETIADRTEYYSGSDMGTLIKNACYEPLRKFQNATHFKVVTTPQGKQGLMACDANDPQGKSIPRDKIKPEDIVRSPIDMEAFMKALTSTKQTVGPEDLVKFEEWTKEFGMEG